MGDQDVAALLDSAAPLVVIEAPAGCGKTFQGANYARRCAQGLRRGRVLILTHTHSACSQFAKETKAVSSRIEIKTIDSLIVQAAAIYHRSLDLPPDPAAWARAQDKEGFEQLATRVAELLACKPMIAAALAERYPVIVADEHQDSSAQQHRLVMALHAAGAHLRVFGDPMQAIYGRGERVVTANRAQWESLKVSGAFAELEYPHRWAGASSELGEWTLQSRRVLRAGGRIDLGTTPAGLQVIFADNTAKHRGGYLASSDDRRSINRVVDAAQDLLILSAHNATVDALRAFWKRRFPIWEGHRREALGQLVASLTKPAGAETIGKAATAFIEEVCKGFSSTSHGERFSQEIASSCAKATYGKPARIQELARCILHEPNHLGVAKCLRRLLELVEARAEGFSEVCIDYRREFHDALKLERFTAPDEGLAEINRRRSFAHPMPPPKCLSTIHKAKGLECDHALVIPCDGKHFGNSDAARCKLYVAVSRARRRLSLVVPRVSPSPLLTMS